jgi:hypothetical protein
MTRLFGSPTRRRAALAATGAAGLAALTTGTLDAQQNDDAQSAAARRRARRGPRGKRGRPGPRAGSGVELVTNECTNTSTAENQELACTVPCPAGFIASGGGFNVGDVLETLGSVRHSEPTTTNGRPDGWSVTLEFFDIGQEFTYSVYAVCLPG